MQLDTLKTHQPEVWPVIHLSTAELARSNADLAFRVGCPGVMVISMDGHDRDALATAIAIKKAYPDKKVGVNLLQAAPLAALQESLLSGLDATWTDSPGVSSAGISSQAEEICRILSKRPEHLFFGSVAFKYQPDEPNPALAVLMATRLGMIPTTSGPATGSAPSAAKLADLRLVLGKLPLAVASGFTPDNAYELGRFVSHILVATGVSSSFYVLDEGLLSRLLGQLQGF